MIEAVQHGQDRISEFDTSCFTGEYLTGDVTPDYLKLIESQRSDKAKSTNKDNELDLSEVSDVQEKRA